MSRRADLYAELARIFAELAQLEDGAETKPAPKRPRARPLSVVPSEPPVSEIARARARRALRRHGYPIAEE